jgi:riboflavin kinase / FMN adenylyltransferase
MQTQNSELKTQNLKLNSRTKCDKFKLDHISKLAEYNISNYVAAIGVFDGIHLGHRKLIHSLIEMSKKLDSTPVLITFLPHPRQVLLHETNISFLRSVDAKTEILYGLGIEAIVTIPFTKEFSALSPCDFIKYLTYSENLNLKGICVGSKWKFGANGLGNKEFLKEISLKQDFEFIPVDEIYLEHQIVSSSSIRKALAHGNFCLAEKMLDAKYFMDGKVLSLTEKNRNNEKTLECQLEHGLLPPIGKYRGEISINNNKYIAIIDINSSDNLILTASIITNDSITLNNKLKLRFTV